MTKNLLFIISLLFTASVNAAGVNLIVNGSFEDKDIQTKSWSVYNSIPGWSTVSGAGIEIRDHVVGDAYHGEQFIELDSHNNSYMIQNVANTRANQSYLLSFAYSPRMWQPDYTNGISVFWNSIEIASITATGGATNQWTMFDFIVQGTGDDVLGFAAIGKNDSLGGNIDAVSVSAVPLPATVFMLMPVLVGLFGLRRKIMTKA